MVRHPETHVDTHPTGRLTCAPDRPGPVRGVVLAQNHARARINARDIQRWLRLERFVHKTHKVDILANGHNATHRFNDLWERARAMHLRLSWRTENPAPPPRLADLAAEGLLDVFLTPPTLDTHALREWLNATTAAQLPARVQIPLAALAAANPDTLLEILAAGGVTSLNIVRDDPFVHEPAIPKPDIARAALDNAQTLAAALEHRAVECNILGIPFCLVHPTHWPRVQNQPQFFLDHQHYLRESYELAVKLWRRPPVFSSKIVAMTLGKYTLLDDPIDNKLLPWIIESPWIRARVVAWHKLTRHLRLIRSVPASAPEDEAHAEKNLQRKRRETIHRLGPLCGICSLRHICDRESPELRDSLPGAEITPQDGDVVMYPRQFAKDQPKHFDPIDRDRLEHDASAQTLADRARAEMADHPPDREIDSYDYQTENQWCQQLPGGVRWFGFTNSEKRSTPLASLSPPFTLSVVFGGGIAEFIGFDLGRDCKLVCPMEGYNHQLVLHVETDGRYVLLRDGHPVAPVAFEGRYYAPLRLGDRLEPRISIWNIDNSIVTQNVALWAPDLRKTADRPKPTFSVITVCVRYARRLQTVLQAVAHQRGIAPHDVEIIVAYVPGVDMTEDVIDSVAAAHPELPIHRSTFSERKARAKGFIINETLKKAHGDWIVLLDADTVIPPNFFEKIREHTHDADFIVPDGRMLLSRETTASVLLGEKRPWEHWDELLATAGEFRYREMDGVPIGFCQVVRRACFDKVTYYEADHFEGADWQFSIDMRKHFGNETRLSGVPVLHLDHGGSKWYGAQRHF